jgi:hypothetical protein
LADITEKLSNGEYFVPESNSEKACFQVLYDLDYVAGKVKGLTTSEKYMHNEIWSLIAFAGAPSWYITLDWNAEVSKKRQELLDQRNLYNNTNNQERKKQLYPNSNHHVDLVKIIDRFRKTLIEVFTKV